MIHQGDLIINAENAAECEKITEVTGWLEIYADVKMAMEKLKEWETK